MDPQLMETIQYQLQIYGAVWKELLKQKACVELSKSKHKGAGFKSPLIVFEFVFLVRTKTNISHFNDSISKLAKSALGRPEA